MGCGRGRSAAVAQTVKGALDRVQMQFRPLRQGGMEAGRAGVDRPIRACG